MIVSTGGWNLFLIRSRGFKHACKACVLHAEVTQLLLHHGFKARGKRPARFRQLSGLGAVSEKLLLIIALGAP